MSSNVAFNSSILSQSGGVVGGCDLRASFHPVLPVCGHLVAEFVEIFG